MTQRVLLDAAYRLFDERGYAETTMRDVARYAGVAPGTIFVHFPDKGSLLLAAYETDIDAVIREGLATLPQSDVRAQVLHLAGRLYQFYARRPRVSRELVQNALFLVGSEGSSLESQVQGFLTVVNEMFTAALERGELRHDLAAADAALGFFSDYLFVLLTGLRRPNVDVEGQKELLERLLTLRFEGMRARAPTTNNEGTRERPGSPGP